METWELRTGLFITTYWQEKGPVEKESLFGEKKKEVKAIKQC